MLLSAIAVCNLYAQGGMKLRHVAWLALGLVIGLGDLLVYSLFFVVAYKAYGKRAATIAVGLIVVMGGVATAFIPFLFNFSNANLDTLVPAQSLAGRGGAAVAPQVEQAPAPEPVSI